MKKIFKCLSEKMNIKKIIKPRNEEDYYRIGHCLISRGFIGILLIFSGILALYYLLITSLPFFLGEYENGTRIYSYDSFALKFVSDTVKIKAQSGYIAYYGEVKNGMANGRGTLYTKEGEVRYEGIFKENEYNETGILYNEDSVYQGEFEKNEYEGEGTLYDLNGSREYEGEFHNGKKSGKGAIYNQNELVFTGNFQNDKILYQDFLGKTAEEIAGMYTGKRTIYYDETNFVVDMTDISVLYAGTAEEDRLDEGVLTERIFIIDNECMLGGKILNTIEEIRRQTGGFSFEGNSRITMQEAVALKQGLETKGTFADALEVTDYEKETILYLHMAEYNSIQYVFYSYDRQGGFVMYSMEK